jgi:glyoxylase-like metal-dependent hydrolase (beta-lactamase superfamily II)
MIASLVPDASVPGVLVLASLHGGRRFQQFFLDGPAALLVDTGMAGWVQERILPQLRAVGVRPEAVRYVLNTHADVDHYGGNGEVRAQLPGATLLAHAADAPLIEDWSRMVRLRFGIYARCGHPYPAEVLSWLREAAGPAVRPDVLLRGGEVLRLGPDREVEIVRLPGHSRGMVGVWDPRHRVLVGADAALGAGMPNERGVIEGPTPYFDPAAYRRTLRRRLGYDFSWLLLSHHPVMDQAAGRRFLQVSLDHTYALETALLRHLAADGAPAAFETLYRGLLQEFGPYPVMPNELCAPLAGHLRDLVRGQRVVKVTDRGGAAPRFKLPDGWPGGNARG